jgi:hypothetical protein
MYECPFCHRKFIEHSFEKHRKYCEKEAERKAQQLQSNPLEKSPSKDLSSSKIKFEPTLKGSSPHKNNRKTPALFRQKMSK